jgi:hypothetical protein
VTVGAGQVTASPSERATIQAKLDLLSHPDEIYLRLTDRDDA